jgi:two-component system cell cycle response regulator DivK
VELLAALLDGSPYVLIVDDFPDGREMLAEYLEFRGLTVVTAANGADALRIAREHTPTVILMDLTMPGIDGWEATRQLKADRRTHASIVIAVTAHALAPDEGMALRAGADGFVSKPFDLTQLADAVALIMKNGRVGLKHLRGVDRRQRRRGADRRRARRKP